MLEWVRTQARVENEDQRARLARVFESAKEEVKKRIQAGRSCQLADYKCVNAEEEGTWNRSDQCGWRDFTKRPSIFLKAMRSPPELGLVLQMGPWDTVFL
jgi:hypothetical protein